MAILRTDFGKKPGPAMINEHVLLSGPGLVLVPYLTPFVPRYHEWMCDPALLAATESDPLTLEEEYENQLSWLHATDKLTFVLLAPVDSVAGEPSPSSSGVDVVSLRGSVRPLDEVYRSEENEEDEKRRAGVAGDTDAVAAGPAASHRCCCAWDYPGSIVRPSDRTRVVRAGDAVAGHGTLTTPLLERFAPLSGRSLLSSTSAAETSVDSSTHTAQICSRSYVMIGDCNLFLLHEDDEEGGEEGGVTDWSAAAHAQEAAGSSLLPGQRAGAAAVDRPPSHTFEVEVMVADRSFRRRGLAETAVRMLMQYAVAVCGATRFVAKILDTNAGSLALFTDRLKFSLFKEVKVFHELHLERRIATAEERAAWEAELAEDRRGERRSEASEKLRGPAYWCEPLTEATAASLRIVTKLPEGCGVA